MPIAPEHYRAARLAFPRLPLPAILGFAVTGLGGALLLAYSSFSSPATTHSLVSANEVPVYEARAVPLDPQPETFAQRAISIARVLTATQGGLPPAGTSEGPGEVDDDSSALVPSADGELRGFSRFAHAGVPNNYLALTGAAFGLSAQTAPSGFFAPASETAVSSAVPEASTWLCGAALLALVVARGLHASWYRHQRRSGNKTDSVRS